MQSHFRLNELQLLGVPNSVVKPAYSKRSLRRFALITSCSNRISKHSISRYSSLRLPVLCTFYLELLRNAILHSTPTFCTKIALVSLVHFARNAVIRIFKKSLHCRVAPIIRCAGLKQNKSISTDSLSSEVLSQLRFALFYRSLHLVLSRMRT